MATRSVSARERRLGKRARTLKNRKDPSVRGSQTGELVNPDKRMHYVLAYKNHAETGAEYYELLGYKPVRATENGVAIAGQKSVKGEIIEYRGHVLMELPIDGEDGHEQLTEYGADGRTGQNFIDKIEDVMLDTSKPGVYDPQRGFTGQHIRNKYFSVVDDRAGQAEDILA